MDDLIAEIQVRTLAQHMWAEASHVLQYKREDTVPASIRRALYRSSAILETLDLEFDRVLQERDAYRRSADVAGSTEVLNVDLLGKTLDAALPAENRAPEEPYAELLSDLQHFEIVTVDQLHQLLKRRLKETEREEKENVLRAQEELASGREPIGTEPERVKRGVYFSHVGWVRVMLGNEYGQVKLL